VKLTAAASQNVTGVRIGTEMVAVGDNVGENRTPWIQAMVIGIEEEVSEVTGKAMTKVTVVWLKDERHGNMIARRGRTRRYVVDSYGNSDIRKV